MGRLWVMPCVGHLIQSLMYSCPQRADSLMNFEGQTFCFLCSLKVPRYPQGCQHSTSFNHRRLMGKEGAALKEREMLSGGREESDLFRHLRVSNKWSWGGI